MYGDEWDRRREAGLAPGQSNEDVCQRGCWRHDAHGGKGESEGRAVKTCGKMGEGIISVSMLSWRLWTGTAWIQSGGTDMRGARANEEVCFLVFTASRREI